MVNSLIPYSGAMERCPICLDNEKTALVVHRGEGGKLHPFHKVCMETWVKQNPVCPMCKEKLGEKVKVSFDEKDVEATIMVIMGIAAGFFSILILQYHYPEKVRFIDSGPIPFTTSVTVSAILQQRQRLHPVAIFLLTLFTTLYFDTERPSKI